MAAFSSVQSGNFNDSATWGGAGFPTSADTFTVNANHTVTVPVGVTAESSGTLTGSGSSSRAKLVVPFGAFFVQSGDVLLDRWDELEMFGSWDLNGNNLKTVSSTPSHHIFNSLCPSNQRGLFSSSVAGVGDIGRTADAEGMVGSITVDHADFVDCGFVRLGRNYAAGGTFTAENLSFTRCDEIRLGGFHDSSGDFVIDRIDVRDSRSSETAIRVVRQDGASSAVSETDRVQRITVDRGTGNSQYFRTELDNIDLGDDIILKNIILFSFSTTNSEQKRVLMYLDDIAVGATDAIGLNGLKNEFYIYTAVDNPHVLFDPTAEWRNFTIENSYESLTVTDRGDAYNMSTVRDQVVTGTLLLEREGGVFANALGTSKTNNYTINHNTLVMTGNDPIYGHLFRTETGGTSSAGNVSMQSNLVVNIGGDPTCRAINIDAGTEGDITTMDFNCFFGYNDPYDTVTDPVKVPGVTPGFGGNDIQADPMFFDSSRDFAAFGSQIGVSQVASDVIDKFLSVNGYESATGKQTGAQLNLTVNDLSTWVRDGFRVTNPAFEDAGHDGVTVGAMGYVAKAVSGSGLVVSSLLKFGLIRSTGIIQ